MRNINTIIVHCSATEEGKEYTVDDIRQWHRERGFNDIGYHLVIDLNGTDHLGRSIELTGAHAKGYNEGSIGICYIGGLKDGKPHDTRTEKQKEALLFHIKALVSNENYNITTIIGHNDISNKACPCFNAKEEYKHLLENNE